MCWCLPALEDIRARNVFPFILPDALIDTSGKKMVQLELIMAEAPVTKIKVVKEKRRREKPRKPDRPRTNQRAANMRRR